MKSLALTAVMACLSASLTAQGKLGTRRSPTSSSVTGLNTASFAGLYRISGDHALIVRPLDSSELQITDMKTGEVRVLSPQARTLFTHGPNRRQAEPVTGRVRFNVGCDGSLTGLVWQSALVGEVAAARLPLRIRQATVDNGDRARIHGALITTAREKPHAIVVVVPLGDRYSLWEPAMWLVNAGLGVFVYDQRLTGASTGKPLEGPSHTFETLLLADDAVAVTQTVRSLPGVEPSKVGIMGWSQGGWIGAMVLSRIPDLAFYVNVAANANPWPQQGRHRFWARLQREGFDQKSLTEAAAYFDAYHEALSFKLGWDEYQATRTRFLDTKWFQFMLDKFPYFQETSYQKLLGHYLHERDPALYFERVSDTPTLGVYFEFDQSNPPDSPDRFRRALGEAGNEAITLKVFPGLDHGAWVVPGYAVDSSRITRRGTTVFEEVGKWILQTVR